MPDETTSLLAPFLEEPSAAAIVADFDGTLSPIVDDPATARPVSGAVDALADLARRYGLVAVMSGRPTDFLRGLLPPEVVLSGLYGLEVVRDGGRADHPGAGAWRETVADVVRMSADRGPDGMDVEPKGLSVTLHYRRHPELADAVEAWARRQATRSGLVVRPAKMSIELHPPIDADKGSALESLVDELRAACFLGDDIGDLPAFDALDRMAERGIHTVRVGVTSDETPDELVDRADVLLDGPAAVVGFLRSLAPD